MIDRTPATTALERSVRISRLVADANRQDLQALLELGARRAEELNGTASGPDFDAGVLHLAAAVTETFEPEVPAFLVEEWVSLADCDPADARLLGQISDRYLNERGQWEYQVRISGGNVLSYAEPDIAPFNG